MHPRVLPASVRHLPGRPTACTMIEPIPSRPSTKDTQPPAYCLSIHAGYLCRHAGACCTAGWDVPVETDVVAAISARFASDDPARFFHLRDPRDEPILRTAADGACVFFDAAHGRLCRIHRSVGANGLPSACRQFPRITLRDARGTWITLSHFCPTAARLLFTPAPLHIVSAPEGISLAGAAEGLDATAALPPLLRRGMLMDQEGYTAWEQMSVELLGSRGSDARAALAAVEEASRTIREWSPGGETLRALVTRTMARTTGSTVADDPSADTRRHALALASVPRALVRNEETTAGEARSSEVAVVLHDFDAVIRRYLASKLFASWWAYLGLDLMGVVEAIQVHRAVLQFRIARRLQMHDSPDESVLQAIRDTELLMAHKSDSRTLARLIAHAA